MNRELEKLYNEDQAERSYENMSDDAAVEALRDHDRQRRERVREMLAAGEVTEGLDLFRAALIIHHGDTLDDFWEAHTLSNRAAEMGVRSAKGLAAMAYDRWLLAQGEPQKFGTQFVNCGDTYRLLWTDPLTTDEEREEWGVLPASEYIEMLLADGPPPRPLDLEHVPWWIRKALEMEKFQSRR